MQKDVIYIDVDDDITAIIGKVKAAKHRIVALVPPKRTGALQSAVNLRLLARAAEQSDKKLVLISNHTALSTLAASAAIPVAKNLQSRPELAEVPVLEVDDDDIIDGASLPVGDLAKTAPVEGTTPETDEMDAVVSEIEKTDDAKESVKKAVATPPKRAKVPNFDAFRKKLLLIGGGVALLIGLLVWAFVFAPSARIVITARTTNVAVTDKITVNTTLTSDYKAKTLKAETKTIQKTVSIPFTATGTKQVGDSASGPISLTNSASSAQTLAAGTTLTSSSGLAFTLSATVTIPAATLSFSCTGYVCLGTATGSIIAAAPGTKYNGATGSLSGEPSGVSAILSSATGGGTDKTATIVQQSDVDAVASQVAQASSSTDAKSQLISQFGSNYIVLDSSFATDAGAVKSAPAVGSEATDGKGALAGTVTYSMTAVSKTELATYLDAYFTAQVNGKTNQKIYENGVTTASLTSVTPMTGGGFSAQLATNGKIGPQIDENQVKDIAKGKRYGEVQSQIESIQGIDNVDIKFSYFWVQTVPNDTNKIHIEFQLNG